MKRRLKALSKIFLGMVVIVFLFLLFERIRGQVSLARYKRELISKGEKLNSKDFLPSADEGENGAPEILAAIKQLKKGNVLPDNYPPAMRLTPSGHAVIGFREKEWIGYDSEPSYKRTTNNWIGLSADLKTNEATLGKIRAALNKPVFSNDLDLTQGPKLLLPHLSPAKSLAWWCGAKSQLALHESNTREATDELLAALQAPRLMAGDHIAISELVRIAIMAIDCSLVWEALQADGWRDEDLDKLQAACQKQEFISSMTHALEGERIYADAGYDICRKSNDEAFTISEWDFSFAGEEDQSGELRKFLKKQIYCRTWRFAWSYQDQRHNLEYLQRLAEIGRKAVKEKSYASVLPDINECILKHEKENWYDKLRFGLTRSGFSLSRTIAKAMLTESERSECLCAIALKHFSLRHGKLPASLNELVPEFLSTVPTDYMDGKPLKYLLNSDGSFTLYSVGENGTDEGGDGTQASDSEKSTVLWRRKDMVWPSPASPDETAKWREESAKN